MVRLSALVRDPSTAERPVEPPAAAGTPAVRAIELVRGAGTIGARAPADPSAWDQASESAAAASRSGASLRGTSASTRILDELQRFLTDVRDRVRGGAAPSWREFEGVIGRVVTSLSESAELFWLTNSATAPTGADTLVAHHARVAILAVRLGLDLGYEPARAAMLGMAGGVIDVSLWEGPDDGHWIDASAAGEDGSYHAHPQRSAAILTRWNAPRAIVDTVLQHHEREGGEGFPRKLSGAAIGQDAKIVGLVDAYVRRAMPAPGRPALRPHEAIRDIVRSREESFPAALVKALLSEISVFPPGTLVRLNTGEVGQVVAVNRNHPLRPRIEVVTDAKGHRPALPKTIDLSETPFLYITGPITPSS